MKMGLPRGSVVKTACQCRKCGFDPWVRKIPWRRKGQPTLVFLPGKSHGQISLVDYSLWGHKRVGHHLATKQQVKEVNRKGYILSFRLHDILEETKLKRQ